MSPVSQGGQTQIQASGCEDKDDHSVQMIVINRANGFRNRPSASVSCHWPGSQSHFTLNIAYVTSIGQVSKERYRG